jgi:cysteinyl-tRNA synthetase
VHLYNTLERKKVPFIPKNPRSVSMYVCGVTVYDFCHIGHARAYTVFDTIRRFLEYEKYDVKYVQNFTDIDDKIIKRANEQNISAKELTETYINAYFEDMGNLNIQPATAYPKATHYVGEMIKIVRGLIEKDIAYETNGDVCFSIDKCSDYGKLSKKVLEDLEAGSRVDVNTSKKNPFDFVLWKKAKENEPSWKSPWGEGRPGWHLECSAMVLKEFGDTIDIHGGGEDLVFPHHENEIAQSECYTGNPFAKYWIHNGFVTIDKEKMSKSLGNFFTLREVLKQFSGEVIRFFLLKVHYRSTINFSFDGLEEAKVAYSRLKNTLDSVKNNDVHDEYVSEFQACENKFLSAMRDDFNTSEAIGHLFDLNKLINTHQCGSKKLRELGQLIGLFIQEDKQELPQGVLDLIEERKNARKNKDFQKSDDIRQKIEDDFNIIIRDTREGLQWNLKT